MAEYKDVTAIKMEMQQICDNCWHPHRLGGCPEHCGINDAVKAIDSAPTVDAVPVVRCKDCEWWTKQDKSLQGRCARYGTYPTGEWFCAAGWKDGKVNGNETD